MFRRRKKKSSKNDALRKQAEKALDGLSKDEVKELLADDAVERFLETFSGAKKLLGGQ